MVPASGLEPPTCWLRIILARPQNQDFSMTLANSFAISGALRIKNLAIRLPRVFATGWLRDRQMSVRTHPIAGARWNWTNDPLLNASDEPQVTGERLTERQKKRVLSPVGSIALLGQNVALQDVTLYTLAAKIKRNKVSSRHYCRYWNRGFVLNKRKNLSSK